MSKKELGVPNPKTKEKKAPELVQMVVEAIQDIKGLDIVQLDLRKISEASADFFIICHGNSSTHISGICDRVEKNIWDELGIRPTHIEGKKAGVWILLDYFNVVVHVFTRDNREFYDLEGLWSDAKVVRHPNL